VGRSTKFQSASDIRAISAGSIHENKTRLGLKSEEVSRQDPSRNYGDTASPPPPSEERESGRFKKILCALPQDAKYWGGRLLGGAGFLKVANLALSIKAERCAIPR